MPTQKVFVLWSCASCQKSGSIPMPPEYETDRVAMQNAANQDHRVQVSAQYEETEGKVTALCIARNVDFVADWLREGISPEAGRTPRY